jgi:hypothetical protein
MGRPTVAASSFLSLSPPGSLASSPLLACPHQPPWTPATTSPPFSSTAPPAPPEARGQAPSPAPMLISPGGFLLIEIEIVPLFQDNQASRGRGRAGRGFLEPRSPQGCRSQTVPTRSFLSFPSQTVWCRGRSYWGISLGFFSFLTYAVLRFAPTMYIHTVVACCTFRS